MTIPIKVIALTTLILTFAGAVMIGGLIWNGDDVERQKSAQLSEPQITTSSKLMIENETSTPGKLFIEEIQTSGF